MVESSSVLSDYGLHKRATNDSGNWITIANSASTVGTGAGNNFIEFNSIDAFSMFALSSVSSSLPVEWLDFEVSLENNHALLNWSTASEKNNYGFDIEKSTNGFNWEKIGFVLGNGTTNEVSNYEFTDFKTVEGKNYYRLKQVDFDGEFEYSDIKEITISQFHNTTFKIYPNVVQDWLTIQNGEGQVNIYNSKGQLIQSITIEKETYQLSTSSLEKGIYFLQNQQYNRLSTKRFIKQ